MNTNETISTNVRKKGRPPMHSEYAKAMLSSIMPDWSYRQQVMHMRGVRVLKLLCEAIGEQFSKECSRCSDRPGAVKRWPWLAAEKLQFTVLAEMDGLPPHDLVEIADEIERERFGMTINELRAVIRIVKRDRLRNGEVGDA